MGMRNEQVDGPWVIRPLGELSPVERAEFYDDLSEDDPEGHLFGEAGAGSRLYENPRLEVCVLEGHGILTPAAGRAGDVSLHDSRVNVYLERYFVQAMPGRQFDL